MDKVEKSEIEYYNVCVKDILKEAKELHDAWFDGDYSSVLFFIRQLKLRLNSLEKFLRRRTYWR